MEGGKSVTRKKWHSLWRILAWEPKSKIPWRNEGEHVGVCEWMGQRLEMPKLRKYIVVVRNITG